MSFCESVISDNWAQTGLNQFKPGYLSVISDWLILLLTCNSHWDYSWSEIIEPVNVFGMQPICKLKT